MKIFFDTEFTGLRQDTTLVSIGLVAETGQTFYAELTDYNKSHIDGWLQKHVIDNLILHDFQSGDYKPFDNNVYLKDNKEHVANAIRHWLLELENTAEPTFQMWSDVLAYDWVLFCDLFENELPSYIQYIPMDLATVLQQNGLDPDMDRVEFSKAAILPFENTLPNSIKNKHNSLYDALTITKCCYKLFQ